MIRIVREQCAEKEKVPCAKNETIDIGPKDVQSGEIFTRFNQIWKEEDEPLQIKLEQLKESFWDTKVENILNSTWERPLIKHVIMAYGVDVPTEVGYVYRKKETTNKKDKKGEYDGIPNLDAVLWEVAGGKIEIEDKNAEGLSLSDILFLKKKPRRVPYMDGHHEHGGDGSVPYLSLSWAHTWLLHSVRALRHSGSKDGPLNPLDHIHVSHRPKGAVEWKDGPSPKQVIVLGEKLDNMKDTGTSHPHGTKYKPEMIRYHSNGTSRTTGIAYTTTVIEAIGVDHKEATR